MIRSNGARAASMGKIHAVGDAAAIRPVMAGVHAVDRRIVA